MAKVCIGDPHFLLRVMWDHWNTVFRTVLGHAESLVSELREARNRWAHNDSFS